MEKYREEMPLREHIESFRRNRVLADSLKSLGLTDEALVFTRHGYATAVTEEGSKQLEELARISTRIDRRNVYELQSVGVGEVFGKITFVREFVLPPEKLILAVRGGGDLEIKGMRTAKTLLGEYMKIEEQRDRSSFMAVLLRVINKPEEKDVKLLGQFEDRFDEIFVRRGMTIDKILKTPWRMLANTGRIAHTKYYEEDVRKAGVEVFGTHIHLSNLIPSPYDIYTNAGPRQRIEWTGIMLVRMGSWWETRLSNENFAAFHSNINDPAGLRRIVSELSDETPLGAFYMYKDFVQSNRARMMRYEELLEKVG
ncbi:MAG: hypothetical protein Sv326_0909 [Candidatus Fermentimicrarchaeum limneticum]|uniref:Uncharacterized protein n=1 Tax=Fermentimicrarchaeum limneticum TaxID=2795018 RepID=A0A7D6BV95_FERL1|nr:MAG: hypothetical protein Sv326_0909 [Candidatus Fermentimicrarchaeum limneticum]